jgi:hypothetical protein
LVIGLLIKIGQKFVVIGNLNGMIVFDILECFDGLSKGLDGIWMGVSLGDEDLGFLNWGFGILFGFDSFFGFERVEDFLYELEGVGVVFEFEVAIGDECESLDIVRLLEVSLASKLNIMCFFKYLKCILIAGDLKIAATVGSEHIGVIEFDLVHVIDFGIFL